ncbi:CD109 antigen-like [Anopheles funestus]|uniref:CD109 antigen-like n=1 Tax=Anopheles funestus TaxID=62324 RepID=UPI0020C686A9|nr:CD109 antigen-like [Anopheles funestus]
MWPFIRSQILTVIIFIGAAHGVLVVGPKFIRANQDYTVAISNFKSNLSNVNLMLRIAGHTIDGRNVLNVTKKVSLPTNMNIKATFQLPNNLSSGIYKIMIEGQRGFDFQKEVALVYLGKSESGLIQINKPAFKPGDTVQFRVIVLDTELKPPARVKIVQVTIRDPRDRVVRTWPSAELYAGVFENNLQIGQTPMLGIWSISVLVDGEVLVSKTFEVKENNLPSFDVEVVPTVIPLEEHQRLNLTIIAIDVFGKPVKGQVKVELYLEGENLYQKKEFEMHGVEQVQLEFVEYFDEDQRDLFVRTIYTEQYTNHTVVKESQITVYKYMYSVELIKDISYFLPGLPFKCALQFRYHDGTPAKGITGKVEVMDIEYTINATSDDEGLIKLELNPSDNIQKMYITFSNQDGFYFNERVDKVGGVTNAFIKLELNSPIKKNKLLQFWVTSNEQMTFFVYYVLSKGNIIDAGFISPNKQNKYPLRFKATDNMIPKAKVIVMTVLNKTLLHDVLDIDFDELLNKIKMSINMQEVKPGQEIEILLSGRPGAYIGLAAYDKDVLDFNQNHDLFWKDIMRVYNGFGPNVGNEYDMFTSQSMGVFVTTLDDIKFNEADDLSVRNRLQANIPITNFASYRTNFQESWLWKNVTIGRFGTHEMIEAVPDTTTSWYLTGFSIDPVYGLSFMKKSIQLTSIRSFYMLESLPYSIKRGEAVVLQFTLFNNLEREYIADVTLYNVANQTEFIGRPVEDLSYTKSVSVPPKVGVPISFLVKARKLGEITVRVNASIMLGTETDALEKVIRVTPESFVQFNMESRFFIFDTYSNQTFNIQLDINSNVDNDSIAINFQLNPNLFSNLFPYSLEFQQTYPTRRYGENNILNLARYIMVLDFLHAIGSNEHSLIDRATSLSRRGFHNQLRYRQTDGSFGFWRHESSSVFLTAFVATSMQTASKYISEVDMTLVEKGYDWLASKQHSSGRFDEVETVFHKDLLGGLRVFDIGLTSHVVIAFLENKNAKAKHAVVIENAINYLSSQLANISHGYDLSIATYALMLYGHSLKDVALAKLIDMSSVTNEGMERYWRTEYRIETTAYALLSFVLAEKYAEGIPVMRWLVKKRYQSFEGLKALTKFAEKISPSRNDYAIQLKYKKETRHFHINSQDMNIIDFEDIPKDTKSLEINVEGIGVGLLQVIYRYSLNLANFENRFLLDVEKLNTTSDDELQLKVCASFIPSLVEVQAKIVLIEVNLPVGYTTDQNPISVNTTVNPIQNFEIRYDGTTVLVFYNNMGDERNCFAVTAYRSGEVSMKRSVHVVVYDLENPSRNAIKVYDADK